MKSEAPGLLFVGQKWIADVQLEDGQVAWVSFFFVFEHSEHKSLCERSIPADSVVPK